MICQDGYLSVQPVGGNVNFSQLAIKMLHLKSCLYLPVNIFQPPARSPVFTKPLMLYLSCFLSHEALHSPPLFFSSMERANICSGAAVREETQSDGL